MSNAENAMKIVMYETKCPKCKYEDVDENQEPCETCITEFVNRASHTPVKFEEKE